MPLISDFRNLLKTSLSICEEKFKRSLSQVFQARLNNGRYATGMLQGYFLE